MSSSTAPGVEHECANGTTVLRKKTCDSCTSSKVACDGKLPCARCSKMSAVTDTDPAALCTYSAPKKRGPQPGFKRKRAEDERPVSAAPGGGGTRVARHDSHSHRTPGAASSPARDAAMGSDAFGLWLQSLFWPTRFGPLKPSAAESGYLRSFFLQTRTVLPLVDEAAFYSALRDAATWPHGASAPSSSSARAPPASSTADDPHTAANGFVLLYNVVLGIGAAIQGRRVDALLYLQRGVAQIGPALTVPSEMAAVGCCLLALAALRVHPDIHRAQAMMTAAEGMVSSMQRAGKQPAMLSLIFISTQARAISTPPGTRITARIPQGVTRSGGGPLSDHEAFNGFMDALWLMYSECMYGLQGRRVSAEGGSSAGALNVDPALVSILLHAIPNLHAKVQSTPVLSTWLLPAFIHVSDLIVRTAAGVPLPPTLLASVYSWLQASLSQTSTVTVLLAVLCGRWLHLVQVLGRGAVSATIEGGGGAGGGAGHIEALLQVIAMLLDKQVGSRLPEYDLVIGFDEKMLTEAASAGLTALSEASESTAVATEEEAQHSPRSHLPRALAHVHETLHEQLRNKMETTEFSRACTAALHDGRLAATALGLLPSVGHAHASGSASSSLSTHSVPGAAATGSSSHGLHLGVGGGAVHWPSGQVGSAAGVGDARSVASLPRSAQGGMGRIASPSAGSVGSLPWAGVPSIPGGLGGIQLDLPEFLG